MALLSQVFFLVSAPQLFGERQHFDWLSPQCSVLALCVDQIVRLLSHNLSSGPES